MGVGWITNTVTLGGLLLKPRGRDEIGEKSRFGNRTVGGDGGRCPSTRPFDAITVGERLKTESWNASK